MRKRAPLSKMTAASSRPCDGAGTLRTSSCRKANTCLIEAVCQDRRVTMKTSAFRCTNARP